MESAQLTGLIPIMVLLVVASITPGPNNFIVMSLASRGGLPSAFPAIGGVLIGCLTLLGLAWMGVSGVVLDNPSLRSLLGMIGAAYLVWMGIALFRSPEISKTAASKLPQSLPGLALFQLSNPKAWLLVTALTAAAAKDPGTGSSLAVVGSLFAIVCTTSLIVWATLGLSISSFLSSPPRRRGFNRLMGLLLIGTAPLMIF